MLTAVIQDGRHWRCFYEPVQVITAVSPEEVWPALVAVETAVRQQGLYAAGFLTYEASAAFGLAVHPAGDLPLLWFGLYESEQKLAVGEGRLRHIRTADLPSPTWQPAITWPAYHAAIQQIKEAIARGDTYQVNYTFPLQAEFSGDPLALFGDLAQAQQGSHAAYVDTGRFAVCSASPELFFRLEGDVLTSKPMKGTAVRGKTLAEDEANIAGLAQSDKNRAENVMIVDMIRNDMGRVAQIGSVQVPELFAVERYPTVLQMTSTVQARTTQSLPAIFRAMFPCASITGAPKVRTMEMIRELEPQPRGVYTGAVGFISPEGTAQFNVAIRTVTVDKMQGTAVYGVGSGIVWDSDAAAEFAECEVKARVLAEKRPSFSLLESLLWQPDRGYFLLEAHVQRLLDSAVYFGIPLTGTAVRHRLVDFAASLNEPCKIRVLVTLVGELTVEAVPLAQGERSRPLRVALADTAVTSETIWLYHKTTRREIYEQARAAHPTCDEVILWNERGELTEATTANLVLDLEGTLWTPPLSSGLLAGTFRQYLLANGRIQERVLTRADLKQARQILLINSVRQWQTAVFNG